MLEIRVCVKGAHPISGKGLTGPGGIKCVCCTKGLPKTTKSLTNRWIRHTEKRNLRNFLKEIE